jgi:two-component system, sensor histidine kinase LadS
LNARIASFLVFILIPVMMYSGIYCWIKGNISARLFTLAWGFYLSGSLLLVFRNFGFLPNNFLTSNAAAIGGALEVIFLSLALADKYKLLRERQAEMQQETLRIQKEANENLERKVKERTIALRETNEELNQSLDKIKKQSQLLHVKNKKITDSIRYASFIQNALLPIEENIKKTLPQSFILLLPRDIVSGDFYWFSKQEEKILIGALDCTGHGVPGALMSMIGSNILKTIVEQEKVTDPGKILRSLDEDIEYSLNQKETKNKDGMDAAICSIELKKKLIHFAGAHNPLIYFQDGKMFEIKGDRKTIGGDFATDDRKDFKTHTVSFEKPTMCYLFSDGFQDQFGGKDGKKLMPANLRNMLKKIHTEDVSRQKDLLETYFNDWKGEHEQVDDVLVIGFRLK